MLKIMPGFYGDKTEMRLLFMPWQGSASLAWREEPSGAAGARGNVLLPQAGKGICFSWDTCRESCLWQGMEVLNLLICLEAFCCFKGNVYINYLAATKMYLGRWLRWVFGRCRVYSLILGAFSCCKASRCCFFSSSSTRNIFLQQSVTPWLLQDIADFRFIFISNINEQELMSGSSKNIAQRWGLKV